MTKKPYQTDNYGLAAYLLLKGVPFLGAVGKKDVYKKFFIFENTDGLATEAANWEHGLTDEATLCKKYFIKTSIIKQSLKEERVLDVE